jgi:fructose-bisphosphate aldolase/6-deoxy-5-ketofructose 1-phosphate synthase
MIIPASVAKAHHKEFTYNYATITKKSNRLFLFAADQKMEHLNADFYGKDIHPDAATPEHLFTVASQGTVGAFATQLGLIARYGNQFPAIAYIAKLNGKTDALSADYADPLSLQLWTLDDVMALKKSGLSMCGVGYTIYLGSMHEATMLKEAAQIVIQAHQRGLVAILWIYARGKSIDDDQDAALLAGAAGLGNALGADFVKIKAPSNSQDLQQAVHAAGNTGVICSGGATIPNDQFLRHLELQLHSGARGCATGRNIFQKSTHDAVEFSKAIAKMVYNN